MTQDQPGQAQGTDYVVRGEVVPDDETEAFEAEQSGPMTRLRKVASALRGDQPDHTVPDQTFPDQTVPHQAVPDQTVPDRPIADQTVPMNVASLAVDRPDDVGAVRSPDAEDRDYWDEQDMRETAPEESATASDPSMADASTYGTTAATSTGGTGLAPGYGSQADTAAGYGSRAGIAPDPLRSTGTGLGATEGGTAECVPGGKHAAAENAGLRPGEATDRLGDFGDIAFGNLLPDAEQYTALWQQIQFRFVDDPEGSVTEAADVVSEVTTKLEAAIRERQRAIEERQRAIQERASALRGRWGEGSNADTETLRETLRMYRGFMDQLTGPTS
jgi:hypothetical protein